MAFSPLKNRLPAAWLLCAAALVPGAPSQAEPQSPTADTPAPAERVSAGELAAIIGVLEPEQRQPLLAEQGRLDQFVENELAGRAVLRAARDNGMDQVPAIALAMERARDRVLMEAYLNQLERQNLDPDFPSEEQLSAYYEDNAGRFATPEQVQLWQVYLPVAPGEQDSEVAEMAARLSAQLSAGELDFAQAASEHSAHQASRLRGGYMGLMRVDGLLPEVAGTLATLEEGQVSAPVKTADGYHILKRGDRVASQPLAYEDVRDEIRSAVLKEGKRRLRAGLVERIREAYPVVAEPADPAALGGSIRERLSANTAQR